MQSIIDIYLLYGFELAEKTEDYLVFTYTNGYFSNAEIVRLSEVECSNCKHKYETLGYSVTVISCFETERIHDSLFSGFFSLKLSKQKGQKEYVQYCEKQKEKFLISNYEYLNCDYVIDDMTYSEGLVDKISSKLVEEGPQLVILEAAAGYGKTCTSFEVLQKFSQDEGKQVPLMTELSKNRKASIFKYVLLTEIDKRFPTLAAKVVTYEIRNGSVPLIIDGFDELLSRSIELDNEEEYTSEEAQNMLDTIAQFFCGESKAKILITSRKSAIFTGEKFDVWAERRKISNLITRIELKSPRVRNWIGPEKEEVLRQKNVNLEYIANPILLSILRDKSIEYLYENEISTIIEEYFSTILEREKERQSLSLESKEQLAILEKLAVSFANFDISSEDVDFVKELLFEITKDNIEDYISRYRSYLDSFELLPSAEEFVVKLLHHALLDRVVNKQNRIGFINEFVFGYLLGQAVVDKFINLENAFWEYKYVDLISTAYSIDGIGNKNIVEEKINDCIDLYSASQQLEISNKLFHKNVRAYEDETITDFEFSSGFEFDSQFTFTKCVFVNCIFNACVFFENSFYNCCFYNCTFYRPTVNNGGEKECYLSFFACSGFEALEEAYSTNFDSLDVEEINYEQEVLEQFWRRGAEAPDRRKAFRTMYRGFTNTQSRKVDEAISELLANRLLIKNNYCYELNFAKLEEIRNVLGRGDA